MNKTKSTDSSPFHVMAKPNGPICNLDCHYCFYLEKENLYPEQSDFRMTDEVLETYVRQYIAAQPTERVTFAWQGGEPTLLGLDFFKKVIDLQKKYQHGKSVENTLQTNGILLNDAWGAFFKEHNFLIGLSIDGPEELHNRYRLNKGGRGSFAQVMKGLEYLKKHEVEFNTLTVVQHDNACHPAAVYRFLKQIGSRFMQFIPVVERKVKPEGSKDLTLIPPAPEDSAVVTPWSVQPRQYGEFLCRIFDGWVHQDVGQYFVQIFDVALEAWLGMNPGLCVFSETCGGAMAIEHNGDLYSCDHYVYPQYKLGNILRTDLRMLADSEQQVKFGMDKKSTLPDYCLSCDVRFVCNGECPKHRFLTTPDGDYGLNYLCEGYKLFFDYISPCMRFMANELAANRPPANVMAWLQEKEAGFPSLNLKVNDPCPCMSGKKYKKCCMIR